MQADLLLTVVAWVLAGVFVPALKHKLTAWPRFLASLQAYRLVGGGLTPLVGALLVAAELAIAIGLLATPLVVGWSVLFAQVSLTAAARILLIYFAAMAINVGRGRLYIDCGCGDAPTSLGAGVLIRNLCLVALAGLGLSSTPMAQGAGLLEILLGAAFVIIGLSIYQAAEQLLVNRTTHQRLWQGL